MFTAALALAIVLSGCRKKAPASKDGAAQTNALDATPSPVAEKKAVSEVPIADEAEPSSGPELTLRMRHLLEAVAQNNPELASDILFPRDAYVALRDTADPASAWERKIQGAFARDVERLHRRTEGAARAKFGGFELGEAPVAVPPKKKEFKKPLFRVKHATLAFSVDGKAQHFVIAEMTSWRGAWYVTRLR